MCGIAGILNCERPVSLPALQCMTAALRHRGPDDGGVWTDDRGVGLGHRRLSILDLSTAGHQPMVSHSSRFVIVFNGEIYNHLELRRELVAGGASVPWRGHSDTETLLAGFEHWGVVETITRADGMFALGVWDCQQRCLFLVRDRIGEKPLYYGMQRGSFVFGSELAALTASGLLDAEIDRDALTLYLRYNYVPAPFSIYRGIRKLLPGTVLTVSLAERGIEVSQPVAYWSLRDVMRRGAEHPFSGSEAEATEQLDMLLRDAVRRQLLADVPVGAFLSGGVDSSIVVALMKLASPQGVKTFTIGFHEHGYDEAQYAKAVAHRLGTEHTELYVTSREALDAISTLPTVYSEPFADPSQVPTCLVSRLARSHVTVALSGDGGDEFFGGYERYFHSRRIYATAARLPGPVRRFAARSFTSLSTDQWDRLNGLLLNVLPARLRVVQAGSKLHKLSRLLEADSEQKLYQTVMSGLPTPTALTGCAEPATIFTNAASELCVDSFEHYMMAVDALTYLPDHNLAKLDRAAMSVGLETRVPLLDRRVMEFAWSLPLAAKIGQGESKRILRRVLYRYVPAELIERPKMGFGIPIATWLRTELRPWAESLLDDSRLRSEGFFDPAAVQAIWQQHLSGRQDWYKSLWSILMFQAWLETRNAAGRGAPSRAAA